MPIALHPGALTILAGRPGAGKTDLALDIGRQVALRDGQAVLYASLEMSEEQVERRLLRAEAGFPVPAAGPEDLTEAERAVLARAAARIAAAPFVIDDTPTASASDVYSAARRARTTRGPLGLVIVDYMQLLAESQGAPCAERTTRLRGALEALTRLARSEAVPVLVLSQLARTVDTRVDGRPVLADLEALGCPVELAGAVVLLYRESLYRPAAPAAAVEVIVARNERGPLGTSLIQLPPDGAS